MRRFTIDHNELTWLYPDYGWTYNSEFAEEMFNFYESLSKDLMEEGGYNDQETFTKDDFIDAFMKGTSVAHQYMACLYNKPDPTKSDSRSIKI